MIIFFNIIEISNLKYNFFVFTININYKNWNKNLEVLRLYLIKQLKKKIFIIFDK